MARADPHPRQLTLIPRNSSKSGGHPFGSFLDEIASQTGCRATPWHRREPHSRFLRKQPARPQEPQNKNEQNTAGQLRHRIAKGSYPWQDQFLRLSDQPYIIGNLCRMTNTFKSLLNAEQVSHLIVNNRDHVECWGLNVEYLIHPTKRTNSDIGSILISVANYVKIQN